MADRNRRVRIGMMVGLGLACFLPLLAMQVCDPLGAGIKLKLIALPIVSGTIDIHENGEDLFLAGLKAFASARGSELEIEPQPMGVRCYSFDMLRDDAILWGASNFDSQLGHFKSLDYQFFINRNFYKHDRPEFDAELRPIAEGLARDFQAALKDIAAVTLVPPKK